MVRLTPTIALLCGIWIKRLLLKRILSYEAPPLGGFLYLPKILSNTGVIIEVTATYPSWVKCPPSEV